MRIAILVNDPFELTSIMTTTLFACRMAARGHTTLMVGVEGFCWGAKDGPVVRGLAVPNASGPVHALRRMRECAEVEFDLRPGDVLLLRTNPARDPRRAEIHRATLGLARIARRRGVIVLNDPDCIERVGNKLYLLELPGSVRPRQVVSSALRELLAFAHAEPGPVVLKPLWGTRGDGVSKVDVRSEGTDLLVQRAIGLLDSGPVVAQEYLEDAPAGDTRVLVLEGEVIEVDGRVAAVRRVPQPGEFRSNVHLGASAAAGQWTPRLASVIETVGGHLRDAGVFLAGVDVVGHKVVEVNAYAPGGFMNAEQFEGADFIGAVLDAIQERAALGA